MADAQIFKNTLHDGQHHQPVQEQIHLLAGGKPQGNIWNGCCLALPRGRAWEGAVRWGWGVTEENGQGRNQARQTDIQRQHILPVGNQAGAHTGLLQLSRRLRLLLSLLRKASRDRPVVGRQRHL